MTTHGFIILDEPLVDQRLPDVSIVAAGEAVQEEATVMAIGYGQAG
ncbi:MAG TPA: hypothetical protein VHL31_11590 [Geminicoccus sp.]|nr:hypothetical protein [Geminicoccus sp.]HEX2526922.1 hypothetical protein [Geminicoccus sp.]